MAGVAQGMPPLDPSDYDRTADSTSGSRLAVLRVTPDSLLDKRRMSCDHAWMHVCMYGWMDLE